jgi:hypothetical protein
VWRDRNRGTVMTDRQHVTACAVEPHAPTTVTVSQSSVAHARCGACGTLFDEFGEEAEG